MELPFVAVVDIAAEIARGCPSTAWNVGNLGCHHWILGYYEPETQHEVWDANPDALIASSIALAAGRARKVDGGFIVSGRWPFSSGVDNSDWNMLAVTVYDGDKAGRLAALPGAEVRLRDHRHLVRDGHGRHRQQGHRGRRTCSCPSAARSRSRDCRGGFEHPGAALNKGALFGIPIVAASSHPLSPAALGAAEGAYEHVSRRRWRSAPAPIPARRSRTSRRCRSRSRARAA